MHLPPLLLHLPSVIQSPPPFSSISPTPSSSDPLNLTLASYPASPTLLTLPHPLSFTPCLLPCLTHSHPLHIFAFSYPSPSTIPLH
ncbi:hypothetical protein Pmani_016104 [Petrolisthes manimaculis]|uniref:Uncharacterized protein n=1 Tax=Petrolisthes manimaculis TaxID=1843537 RepID=A0AAE1U734_9EUCA|nr:hypothetical protein Pmani_016104 [Petrolisthes manimaculis]